MRSRESESGESTMMPLPRGLLLSVEPSGEPRYDGPTLLQEGLGGDPWRVIVASVLLCRARRSQVAGCLRELLAAHPSPNHLARAEGLEELLRPCGLHRQRARQLQRLSSLWFSGAWEDARDLPGVGVYVADAVGLVCFGCVDLESTDAALRLYSPPNPLSFKGGLWLCGGAYFYGLEDAVAFRRQLNVGRYAHR